MSCKCMLITTAQNRRSLGDLSIKLNNQFIEQVENFKLLGVIVNQNLSWTPHVKSVAKILNTKLFQLRQLRRILPEKFRAIFYKCHFQPYLDYCSTIWDSHDISSADMLNRQQKIAFRLILGSKYNTDLTMNLKRLNIFDIRTRHNFNSYKFIYKTLNKMSPSYLSNLFKYKQTPYSSINSKLVVQKPRINVIKQSMKYKGTILWNNLGDNFKAAPNFKTFRRMILNNLS